MKVKKILFISSIIKVAQGTPDTVISKEEIVYMGRFKIHIYIMFIGIIGYVWKLNLN